MENKSDVLLFNNLKAYYNSYIYIYIYMCRYYGYHATLLKCTEISTFPRIFYRTNSYKFLLILTIFFNYKIQTEIFCMIFLYDIFLYIFFHRFNIGILIDVLLRDSIVLSYVKRNVVILNCCDS